MTQSDLLKLAKQGNADAIATLMNRQLQPKGILARATNAQGCLKIIFEASEVPNQEKLVNYTHNSISKLKASSIQKVIVYAKQIGNEFPDWQDEFNLEDIKVVFQTHTQKPPFTQQSVQTSFILFTVFWWVGFPLCFIPELALLGLSLLIAAIVFSSIFLYRHWLLLQGHGARTTPGKAVGFSFIPFYCFYWWFVAYAGLAEDNNSYMNKQNINGFRMSYGLSITLCVLGILGSTIGLVPILDIIISIPSAIVGFLFVLQQRNCILAIMQYRHRYDGHFATI